MPRPRQTDEQRAASGAAARRRILEALTELLAAQGFADITVDDVARTAKVSKTTVYAQFVDREAMLLALYDGLTDAVLETVRQVDDPLRAAGVAWPERVAADTRAYLEIVLHAGSLSRSMMVDVPGVGPRGIAARRAVFGRYIAFIDERIREEAARLGLALDLPDEVLIGVVGGIHELVLRAIEREATDLEPTRQAAERLLLGALGYVLPPSRIVAHP